MSVTHQNTYHFAFKNLTVGTLTAGYVDKLFTVLN